MLGYCTIGVTDMERARAFYDELLGELGATRMFSVDRMTMYGTDQRRGMLGICIPYDEEPQAPGNGNMVAIAAGSTENVDKLHAKGLELGGTDEGAPGVRVADFYGAYIRDLDGNKLCFFWMMSSG